MTWRHQDNKNDEALLDTPCSDIIWQQQVWQIPWDQKDYPPVWATHRDATAVPKDMDLIAPDSHNLSSSGTSEATTMDGSTRRQY